MSHDLRSITLINVVCKVECQEFLRASRVLCKGTREESGGIRNEYGLLGQMFCQFRIEALFLLNILGNGFNHKVSVLCRFFIRSR